jgi:excisionase family DNA binding protein
MYELVATGAIPSIRIGRAIRIRPEALEKWIAERETKEPFG